MLEVALWHWIAFFAMVAVLLVLDLVIFHRHSKETTLRAAAIGTLAWCALALSFNGLVWYRWGNKAAIDFLTGYIVEWSLSMDNVFVFAVVFSYFMVPKKYQYRVLFWGILGAVVLRLTFILVGGELIKKFDWVMAIFGVFLIYTGIKLMRTSEPEVDPEKVFLLRIAKRLLPVAVGDHGERFFVREAGRLCMTPLFLVLVVVESTDMVFAVDSVPAIFSITQEPFIVFTSNIFAILGLRSLYFLLAGSMDMFRYLSYGLSAILIFVGGKMLAEYAVKFERVAALLPDSTQKHLADGHHLLPSWVSLLVIISVLSVAIVASIIAARLQPPEESLSEQLPPTPPDTAPAAKLPPEVAADVKTPEES